ncbi:MAG: histidinol-phosphatase HisJ family protein [Clostridia bacterium]|nr:histidinol-phosphatase HisJ family protein [Clostridia bacterium]
MIRSNMHTHSVFSDGKNTPEDIVETALEKGFVSIGFSDHSYTFFDTHYCMLKEKYGLYKETVAWLKEKYKGKIEIYCGTEFDRFSDPAYREGFDYFITGVHYVLINGEYYAVDGKREDVTRAINEGLGGDEKKYVKMYYELVSSCAGLSPLYMGHFDLLTKYGMVDDASKYYKNTALEAVDSLLEKNIPIEVNTGAMAKGIKSAPYPAGFILERIAEKDGCVVFGSDCHDMTKLDFAFESCLEAVKGAGIKNILEFRGGRLVDAQV